jgi:hypothetical protein
MPTALFANLPRDLPEELFTTLLQAPGIRIERIVSHGHSSPKVFWIRPTNQRVGAGATGSRRDRVRGPDRRDEPRRLPRHPCPQEAPGGMDFA